MLEREDKKALSAVRMESAQTYLRSAAKLVELGDYKSAANRSYYAVFQAMRAVLALDGIDRSKHSGIISEFRKLYIKTGIFNLWMSDIINELFEIRTRSDYEDFFLVSREEILNQIENAEKAVNAVNDYLERIN